jgi:hypothetical protein
MLYTIYLLSCHGSGAALCREGTLIYTDEREGSVGASCTKQIIFEVYISNGDQGTHTYLPLTPRHTHTLQRAARAGSKRARAAACGPGQQQPQLAAGRRSAVHDGFRRVAASCLQQRQQLLPWRHLQGGRKIPASGLQPETLYCLDAGLAMIMNVPTGFQTRVHVGKWSLHHCVV